MSVLTWYQFNYYLCPNDPSIPICIDDGWHKQENDEKKNLIEGDVCSSNKDDCADGLTCASGLKSTKYIATKSLCIKELDC
jgi:hypothetical protein